MIVYATLNLAHMIAIIAVVIQHGDPSISPSKLQELAKRGPTSAAGAILACPLVLAVLWVTIRIARRRFAEYLALNLPSRAELLSGLAITLAFLLACNLLSYLTGQAPPAFVIDSYRTARDAGQLWLLLVGFCIAAPITEEFTVQGGSVSRLVAILSRADRRDRCIIGGRGRSFIFNMTGILSARFSVSA